MAHEIDYLPFATGGGANVMTQAAYLAAASTAAGYSAGIADPTSVNKALRQSSMFAAALATLISNELGIDVLDDGNLAALVANLTLAIQTINRVKLTANTTFFVNGSTGNDTTGNGLTSGTAWATLQHAWNFIANQLDLNGFNVSVSVANGTYTTGVFASAPLLGSTNGVAAVSFVGNLGTPDSVVISTSGGAHCFFAQGGAEFSVSGMKLTAAGTNACCIVASVGGIISFQTVDFGAAANAHILASNGGFAQASGNYSITGAAAYHVLAAQCANASIAGVTATLTGTPAFSSAFAGAQQCGQVVANAYLQTGGATGSRYAANTNGVIYTAGGGATYLPGNAGGTTATGGQYV